MFILIEHQSEPDELMLFRVLRYVVLIYERQAEEWLRSHSNLRRFRFNPVLPIVFYSGTRTWEGLKAMTELVQQGKLFARRLPTLEPEFINLSRVDPAILRSKGGTLGWVLWLIQQKRQSEAGFRDVLQQVVTRIDKLHGTNRGRWESLLWFLQSLVYHARKPAERAPLADFICSTVRKANQPETATMAKTIAEAIMEEGKIEGKIEGKRDMLLFQLRTKFKQVPEGVVAEIQSTTDDQQFAEWSSAILTADRITDIPFHALS